MYLKTMSECWQDGLRRVILANPKHFVTWLLPGAHYIETVSSRLSTGYLQRFIMTGPLLHVKYKEEELLLHVEFQALDEVMDTYLLTRHTLALHTYQYPVLSYIIYIRNEEPIIAPPLETRGANGEQLLCFDFKVIKLWEYCVSDLQGYGLPGLLPLLPLAYDGANREAVNLMIKLIIETGQLDLLSAGRAFAEQTFTNELDRYWLDKKLRAYAALVD